MRCFSPPLGAAAPATVVFTRAADGSVTGEPEVVTQGTTPLDQAFAKAAVRAILRCAPYAGTGAETVRVTFSAAEGPAAPSSAAAPTSEEQLEAAAMAELASALPEGLCAVRPDGPPAQAALWQRFTPPAQRGAAMLVLAVDCPSLARADAAATNRPKRVLMVLGGARQGDPPPLETYLTTLEQRFNDREPLTDRFWQSPPAAGAPVVGRDARAVYVAQRRIGKADGITVAGISGYTRLGNRPVIVNALAMDGSDVNPQSRAVVAAVVERLHASFKAD